MPSKPARTPPINLDCDQTQCGSLEGGAPQFATLGLSSAWQIAFDWAQAQGALYEFLQLLDCTLVHKRELVFGTLLQEISQPVSLGCLTQWIDGDQAAAMLLRLAQLVKFNPEILKSYPPLRKEKKARAQLRKNLARDYMIAMAIEGLPDLPEAERNWFQVMRIWVMVHGLMRSRFGVIQDAGLRVVATEIRLACERDEARRKLISMLSSDAETFDDLNQHISDQAAWLLHKSGKREEVRKHSVFLKALISVATGVQAQDDKYLGGGRPVLISAFAPECPTRRQSASQASGISLFEDETEHPPATQFLEDEESAASIELSVEGLGSYAHQRLASRSVFLHVAEEYQYLPWSWSKPSPDDMMMLKEWVERELRAEGEVERLLAAITWICLRTGRSLRRALVLQIGDGAAEEWVLETNGARLLRLPPKRQSAWLPRDSLELSWVRPEAGRITIDLPAEVRQPLQQALTSHPDASCLGELWSATMDPHSVWRQMLPRDLSRITPGMLGQVLPQRIFQKSGDAVLARLLSSQPGSGMPGACAYATWSADEVDNRLGDRPAEINPSAFMKGPIGAGSRLDPIDDQISSAMEHAYRKLSAASDARTELDLLKYHNAYTAYCVVMLLAGTGARPVTDPFESPAHFDLERQFCYVDDKASDFRHEGRLVPLPSQLVQFLRDVYPRHLFLVASALETKSSDLAMRIHRLAEGDADTGLPYFFMLDSQARTAWASVSEATIMAQGLFSWPLPLRLFRHRLATRLRWLCCDPEIIDGLLGHAEAASASYGDHSLRVWQEDMNSIRPQIDEAWGMLGIRVPHPWPVMPSSLEAARLKAYDVSPGIYGIRRRRAERERHRQEAQSMAEREIEEYLGGRELASLAEDDLDELGKRLFLNHKGLPRANGHIRYDVLMDRLEQLWSKERRSLRLRKRFVRSRPMPSVFLADACRAQADYRKLRAVLSEICKDIQPSRLSHRECGVLAAVGLCLERQVAARFILEDLSCAREVRLVSLAGRHYLEHGELLKPDDPDAAVRRMRLGLLVARLVDRLLAAERRPDVLDEQVPGLLLPLCERLMEQGRIVRVACTVRQLIHGLSVLVDQLNVQTLPGVVAGYLAGRVESYALGWRDWSRLELGEVLEFGKVPEAEQEEGSECEPQYGGVPRSIGKDSGAAPDEQVAADFIGELRKALDEESQDTAHATSRDKRKALARKLGKIVASYNGRVSGAMTMLGQWLPALAFRPGKKGTYLVADTLGRYLDALAPPFLGLALEIDLLELDEDQVTFFYSDLIDSLRVADTKYVAERLADFHRWASLHGVADPDWSELPEVMRGRRAAPGFIAEQEYQTALGMLAGSGAQTDQSALARQVLLLLCYRYGLREMEALGLLRDDIREGVAVGNVTVLVRDNHLRKLKTNASRRQVPLLFRMTDAEYSLLWQWQLQVEAVAGDRQRAGIFLEILSRRDAMVRIVRPVIDALKLATGNPRMVLHHARHTAPNRLALELFGLRAHALRAGLEHKGASANRSGIPQILLGRTGVTRRAVWALSCYTGHAGGKTLLKSYLHICDIWHEELLPVAQDRVQFALKCAHVLDRLPRVASIAGAVAEKKQPASALPDAVRVVQFLRLLARRHLPSEAARALEIGEGTLDALLPVLECIGSRMKMSNTSRIGKNDGDGYAFLRRLTEDGWVRLQKHATLLGTCGMSLLDQYGNSGREGDAGDTRLALSELPMMIGVTRQLVMWRARHFAAARMLIDGLGIPAMFYRVGLTHRCEQDDQVTGLAREYGFVTEQSYEACKQVGREMQLDTATEGDIGNRVERRCCLLFQENREFDIRNRYELIVLLISLVAIQPLV